MGYFEMASKRNADANPLSARVTIADADIDRITAAYAEIYFPNGVEVSPGDPTADPPIPPDVRPPTGQEVFNAVTTGVIQSLVANTLGVEKSDAARVAQDAVPPIPVAPAAKA